MKSEKLVLILTFFGVFYSFFNFFILLLVYVAETIPYESISRLVLFYIGTAFFVMLLNFYLMYLYGRVIIEHKKISANKKVALLCLLLFAFPLSTIPLYFMFGKNK